MDLYRNIIYQAKNTFRDKGFLFWALFYPLIMTTFFYVAFSGIRDIELEEINVGIEGENNVNQILKSIDILNIKEIEAENAEEKIKDNEIEVFIEQDLNLLVNDSGLNETVVKSILDQIIQTNALNRPIEDFDFDINYIKGENQEENGILVVFYSLIAMVSTYGVFAGTEVAHYIQANLSEVGARINTTPIKKSTFLLAGIIVGLLLNIASNIILFIYIEFILKLNLINNVGYSLIFIILGNLFGIVLGIFIGVSNKKDINIKSTIATGLTLTLAALSGLFTPNIKVMVDKYAPIFSRLNPIGIITNNLYRINLLDSTNGLFEGIIILVAYFVILSLISLIFLRRREYDSI